MPQSNGATQVLTAPWPVDPSQHRLHLKGNEGGAGGDSFLLWAIGAGADLWVPTRAQLAAETTRLSGLLTSEFQIRVGVQDVPQRTERWGEPPSRNRRRRTAPTSDPHDPRGQQRYRRAGPVASHPDHQPPTRITRRTP